MEELQHFGLRMLGALLNLKTKQKHMNSIIIVGKKLYETTTAKPATHTYKIKSTKVQTLGAYRNAARVYEYACAKIGHASRCSCLRVRLCCKERP